MGFEGNMVNMLQKAQIISGVFSLMAAFVALFLIYKHLRNYTAPHLQRYIIRILLMVPIYAIDSWLSIINPDNSSIYDFARDCYEAYCIYCFFALMVTYVQFATNEDVGRLLETKEKLPHPFPLCFLPRIKLGRKFLRQCYQFILQFVFVKPIISITSVVLLYVAPRVYQEQNILKADNAYLWLTVVENISITISLYYLVLYYMATKEELLPFKPVGKFICIKAVIFFSFWQGVTIGLLADLKVIRAFAGYDQDDIGRVVQDFIICIEMFVLAIVHHYVFPYRNFHDPEKVPFLWDRNSKRLFANPKKNFAPVVHNFIQVANIQDVIKDTKNSFLVPLARSTDCVVYTADGDSAEEILVIEEYNPNNGTALLESNSTTTTTSFTTTSIV